MPNLATMVKTGLSRLARCVMPSFTNPNNISIVTGVSPGVHGISGNFFLDPATGDDVMMNDPAYLRAPSILAQACADGGSVAVVTAKDKLRRLLAHGLRFERDPAICFSAEKADSTTTAEHGMDDAAAWIGREVPGVYSSELSEFVFACGAKLLRDRRADVMYLSTTDYVQHKHAPGTPAANDFYRMMDRYLGDMHDTGAVIVLTADHGMSAKHDMGGAPKVVYLQTTLDGWFGNATTRVILPITDPYVAHHGALGSFACVYTGSALAEQVRDRLASLPGLDRVLLRDEACDLFELPPDRIGDVIVVATSDVVIGTSHDLHDLSGLDAPLRSHGGLSEQIVPLIMNRPAPVLPEDAKLRNFDAFDLALNHGVLAK